MLRLGRLVVREGSPGLSPGQVFALDRDEVRIGRAVENEVIVPDERTSRYHARINWDGESYVLQDLESSNGTQLRGKRVNEPQRLKHGDLIALPGAVLAFQLSSGEETVVEQRVANIYVDDELAMAFVKGKELSLTAKEFLTISLLYGKQGMLCTKDELARHVWPEYEGNVADYNIEQLLSRLRRKLEDADANASKYLVTVRGLGYRLISS